MTPPPDESQRDSTIIEKRLDKCEALLGDIAKNVKPPSYWDRFLFGAITGFGTVVGATIVVTIAVSLLSPLAKVSLIQPAMDRIIDALNHRQMGAGPGERSEPFRPASPQGSSANHP